MKFLGFLLSFFSMIVMSGLSQDIQYSQYYANPLYLNPAITGNTDTNRFGVNFRNQWPALDQTYVAYTAFFDIHIDQINSGFGVIVQGANESYTQTSSREIGLLYSYRLKITDTDFIQAGIQGTFMARDAFFDRVILGTQLDINKGVIIGQPGDAFEGDSQIRAADANAGLVYYGKKLWIGTSVSHLLRPEISYLARGENRLSMKTSIHGGYRFNLAPGDINDYFNNTDQERSMAIGFNYKQQGPFTQLDLGTEFFFEPLVLGIWYRGIPTLNELPNNESLIALFGISLSSGMDLGYSFDFPISKFGFSGTGGAHEISLRYVFATSSSGKKYFSPLPSFRY